MKNLLLVLSILVSGILYGQVPTTNIYLFDYLTTEDNTVLLHDPRIITSNNLNGYNNQPHWFNNEQLYITRQLASQTQTDIVIKDLDRETETLFTKTRQSEYSPTPTPDGTHLSCIRVEDDGIQVLWQYPLDRSHAGKRILRHIQDIGYHLWINETELVLFIVGAPHKFVLASTEHTDTYEISAKIGRSFGKMMNRHVLFVYKYTDEIWHLKAYNPITKRSGFIAETPKGSEDFALLDGDTILMAKGSKLSEMKTPYTSWIEIADLTSYDIGNISRLAYQNHRLVIVGQ